MAAQTVEQFLFEQLEKVAPGKYTLASALQIFKSKLRFPCTHLKGGKSPLRLVGPSKDYNLSIFTFPTGVTEIKCLYNCGLKIRSDEKDLLHLFNELYDLPSTNSCATAEVQRYSRGGKNVPIDPGPAPTYSEATRQRIRESTDLFWKSISQGLENGRIKPDDPILGGIKPHPDPIEAPDSVIKREINRGFQQIKNKQPVLKGVVVTLQDSVSSLEPVKDFPVSGAALGVGPTVRHRIKLGTTRKKRKTQSRQRKRSGK